MENERCRLTCVRTTMVKLRIEMCATERFDESIKTHSPIEFQVLGSENPEMTGAAFFQKLKVQFSDIV